MALRRQQSAARILRTLGLNGHTLARSTAWLVGFGLAVGCARHVEFEPHDDRYARCSARGLDLHSTYPDTLTGVVVYVDDRSSVDDVSVLRIADENGELRSARLLPGMSTHKATPDFQAAHHELSKTERGDCVWVAGRRAGETLSVESLRNFDR